ncbi:MAG: redoxin domain-containing protein [Sphingobacteriales bacterium]|nr:MAG: redoxin domain-containing protein [Sphingobacteriales bacterium]
MAMTSKNIVFRILLVVLLPIVAFGQKPLSSEAITRMLTLPEAQHQPIALTPETKGMVLIFTCNHCPFARLYTQRLNALADQYRTLGVPVVAINSMDTLLYEDETLPYMQEKAAAEAYRFAYLQDASQHWGRRMQAQSTPSAFVIWKEKKGWVIKYSGSIDDNGENPELAIPFVRQAVDALLNGKAIPLPKTKTFGCAITYTTRKPSPSPRN